MVSLAKTDVIHLKDDMYWKRDLSRDIGRAALVIAFEHRSFLVLELCWVRQWGATSEKEYDADSEGQQLDCCYKHNATSHNDYESKDLKYNLNSTDLQSYAVTIALTFSAADSVQNSVTICSSPIVPTVLARKLSQSIGALCSALCVFLGPYRLWSTLNNL